MTNIQIHNASLAEAYQVRLLIPEFEPWYAWEKWEERCNGKSVIALVSLANGDPAGFKVGYFEADYFYSWVGGVIPAYRRLGVASLLADAQEMQVKEAGVSLIRMKTRNRFQNMLHFALSRDFYIAEVEKTGEPRDWRIILHKNV